jgi:NUDIX domain
VRVILLDAGDRVLLLGARDPDDGRTVWFMPGGCVEPGESFTESVDRELRGTRRLRARVHRARLDPLPRPHLGREGHPANRVVLRRANIEDAPGRAHQAAGARGRLLRRSTLAQRGGHSQEHRSHRAPPTRGSAAAAARGSRPNHPGRDGRVASHSSKRASETPESSSPSGYDHRTKPIRGLVKQRTIGPTEQLTCLASGTQVAALRVESVADGPTHGRPIWAN